MTEKYIWTPARADSAIKYLQRRPKTGPAYHCAGKSRFLDWLAWRSNEDTRTGGRESDEGIFGARGDLRRGVFDRNTGGRADGGGRHDTKSGSSAHRSRKGSGHSVFDGDGGGARRGSRRDVKKRGAGSRKSGRDHARERSGTTVCGCVRFRLSEEIKSGRSDGAIGWHLRQTLHG